MKRVLAILLSFLCLAVVSCGQSSNNATNEGSEIVLFGSGAPSVLLGNDMDLYVDAENLNVYCKENDNWIPTETNTSRALIKRFSDDSQASKAKALANSFYSTNIVVDFEMEGSNIFTHNIESFNSGILFNEVYTSKEAYLSKDKTSGYYQYQKYYYEDGRHYAEIQGGEKQEIFESDFYYGMAATTFDKVFSTNLNCESLAKELFAILDGSKSELSFTYLGIVIKLSDFSFSFDLANEVLKSMSFKNAQHGINYNCQFSNYGQVE